MLVATASGRAIVARVFCDAAVTIDRFAAIVDDDRKRIVVDVDGRRVRIPLARLSARAWTYVAASGARALYAGINESV